LGHKKTLKTGINFVTFIAQIYNTGKAKSDFKHFLRMAPLIS